MFNFFKEGYFLTSQIDYLLMLQHFRVVTNNIFTPFFAIITLFGEHTIPLLYMSALYWCIDTNFGAFLALSNAANVLICNFLKVTACIYRPWILDARIQPIESALKGASGYSFPSGHTACATSTWGGTAIVFWQKKWIRYLTLTLVLLIIFSRNYLGVHTPQDVIISFIFSSVVLILLYNLLRKIDNNGDKCFKLSILAFIICLIVIAYAYFKSYPIDYLNGKILVEPNDMRNSAIVNSILSGGLFLGWGICKKFVKFDAKIGSLKNKIIRFLIGAISIFIVITCFLDLSIKIFGELLGESLIYFFMGIFTTCLYPLAIKVCNDKILKNRF